MRSALVGTLSSADEGGAAIDGDVLNAVRTFARQYWSTMERNEMVPLLRLAVGELPRFPELDVCHATETLERYQRLLQRIIEGGVERGQLAPLDVRAAARTILAVLAAHAFWFAYPDIYGGLTGPNHETAAEATIDTLLQALRPAVPSTKPAAAPSPSHSSE